MSEIQISPEITWKGNTHGNQNITSTDFIKFSNTTTVDLVYFEQRHVSGFKLTNELNATIVGKQSDFFLQLPSKI